MKIFEVVASFGQIYMYKKKKWTVFNETLSRVGLNKLRVGVGCSLERGKVENNNKSREDTLFEKLHCNGTRTKSSKNSLG